MDCFNPHRPRRAGATLWLVFLRLALAVSILTGPEGPVQHAAQRRRRRCYGFNPHRPRRAGATYKPATGIPGLAGFNPHRPRRAGATNVQVGSPTAAACFNPHRPRRAGATRTRDGARTKPTGFNPHRPRRAGATSNFLLPSVSTEVSILTGPEGPVQRCYFFVSAPQ